MSTEKSKLKAKIFAQFKVKKQELENLCQKTGVKSLSVFGSLTQNNFKIGQSDIDFLVEFDSVSIDRFFDLLDGLKRLFHYENIDLVTLASLKNQIIKNDILSSHENIYAA